VGLRSAQTLNVQKITSTAPVNGLISQRLLAAMTPQDALQLRNFWVKPYGLELRPGYRIHQNNLNDPVNTMMAYEAKVPGDNKLFAVTFQGITDVTARQDNPGVPARDVTFGSQIPGITDQWSWIMFSTGDENYLCAVNQTNGYLTYSTSTGWVNHPAGVAAGEIDGADPLLFDYIMSWKQRLWFVNANSNKAFYLPVSQLAGTVQEFDFGNFMRQGGTIQQFVSWTRDGGDGLDDFLVVIGSQGDVAVYQGTDPANADTFAMVGIWDVGRVPVGRRIAMKSGGDVQVLCETGILPLSELFTGMLRATASETSLGYNIQTILARKISSNLNEDQWELHYYPQEEQVMIKEPVTINERSARIWSASVHNRAWSQLVGLPVQTCVVFESTMYGSDQDGNVYELFIGDSDDVGFDGLPNLDLVGQIQTGFTNYDSPDLKRCQLVEPVFVGESAPGVQVQMKTEFDFAVLPGSPQFFAPDDGAMWDVDFWDQAYWSGQSTYQAWAGAGCLGRYLSLFLSVRGPARLVFTHWTLSFEIGGMM